jgi:hypothetical protein
MTVDPQIRALLDRGAGVSADNNREVPAGEDRRGNNSDAGAALTHSAVARPNNNALLIGLHISECFGPNLAAYVRAKLPAHAWYTCSAFREATVRPQVELAERANLDAIRFVFGHFVHESLLSVFAGRQVVLFTAMRSPIDRAVNEYCRVAQIRRSAGRAPLSVDEFFATRKNSMCAQILRAFPTLASEVNGSLSKKAIAICRIFDFIFGTESFDASIAPLLNLIGLDAAGLAKVRPAQPHEPIPDLEAEIRDRVPVYFSEDAILYEYVRPRLGRFLPFEEGGRNSDREAALAKLLTQSNGIGDFAKHIASHTAYAYQNVGRLAELDALIAMKEQWLLQLKKQRAQLGISRPAVSRADGENPHPADPESFLSVVAKRDYPHRDYPQLTADHLKDAKLFADRKDLVASMIFLEGETIAEVGVAHGEFSEFLLETLRPIRFVAFDLFRMHESGIAWGIPTEVLFEGMSHFDFYKRRFADRGAQVILESGLSHIELARYPDRHFGLIYIDASHEYEDVRRDADVAKHKIKDDGVLIFNDYIMYDHFSGTPFGVVPVVNELVVNEGWRVCGYALEANLFCDIALRR